MRIFKPLASAALRAVATILSTSAIDSTAVCIPKRTPQLGHATPLSLASTLSSISASDQLVLASAGSGDSAGPNSGLPHRTHVRASWGQPAPHLMQRLIFFQDMSGYACVRRLSDVTAFVTH